MKYNLIKNLLLQAVSLHFAFSQSYTSKLLVGVPPKVEEVNPLKFKGIYGIVSNASKELILSDYGNHRIRKRQHDGKIITIAGNGKEGFLNGMDTTAQFALPKYLAIDSKGNLFVTEDNKATIRKIALNGKVTTFIGLPNSSGDIDGKGEDARLSSSIAGITIDKYDNLYITDAGNNKIKKIDTSGQVSTLLSEQPGLSAIAINENQELFYGSNGNIRRATLGSNGFWGYSTYLSNCYPSSMVYTNGMLTVVTFNGLFEVWQNLTPTAKLISPQYFYTAAYWPNYGIVLGGYQDLYRIMNQQASLYDIYPKVVTKNYDQFKDIQGMIVDRQGNVFIADRGTNRILKMDGKGSISTFAGSTESGLKDGKGADARFYGPVRLAWDKLGNLLVMDNGNHALRKITPDGTVTTVLASPSFRNGYGIAVDSKDNIYMAIYSDPNVILKISPDKSFSTYINDKFIKSFSYYGLGMPLGLQIDKDDNLYIAVQADGGIYKVSSDLQTVSLFGSPSSVSVDGGIDVAKFKAAEDIALDAEGNLFVLDQHILRKITNDSVVSTVAGNVYNNTAGYQEGVGTSIKMDFPWCMALGQDGLIYISDNGNNLIRVLERTDVTALEDQKGAAGDLFYPNPTENKIFVSGSHTFDHYQILDAQGHILLAKALDVDHIDLSNLEEGLYTVVVSGAHAHMARKVVKK